MPQRLGERRLDAFLRSSGASHQPRRHRRRVRGVRRRRGVGRPEQHVDVGSTETERVDADVAAFPRRTFTHDLAMITVRVKLSR